jgi:hypothetical protein
MDDSRDLLERHRLELQCLIQSRSDNNEGRLTNDSTNGSKRDENAFIFEFKGFFPQLNRDLIRKTDGRAVDLMFLKKVLFLVLVFAVLPVLSQQSPDDQDLVTLTGDLFGRSSASFIGQSNITSVVPSGSRAQVLETKLLSSGSYAVHVKIASIAGSRGSETAKVGDEVWLYDSKKHPWMKFPDDADPSLFQTTDNFTDAKPTTTTAKHCRHGNFTQVASDNHQDIKNLNQHLRAPAVEKSPQNARPVDGDVLSNYRNNKALQAKVDTMVNYVEEHALVHSSGSCYHYVKEALLLGQDQCAANDSPRWPKRGSTCGGDPESLVHSWPSGGVAHKGVEALEQKPFNMVNLLNYPQYKNMATNPNEIPKGAVVVYSNGLSDGHIEIKASENSSHYYSDFDDTTDFLNGPYNRAQAHPYRIIGVMIPTE